MKKIILLLLLTVATYGDAYAQFVNNGKVIDKKGNPISGATVRGKGLRSSTTTNMDGSFSFETTLPIKKIEASYMGKTTTGKRTEYTVIKMSRGGDSGSSDGHPWFANVQIGHDFEIEDEGQLGIMVGYVKNWGAYLNAMTNVDGYEAMLTVGIVRKIVKGVNIYLGGGGKEYGKKYEKYSDYEQSFIVDLGLLFKFKRVTADIGFSSELDNIATLRIGVGYSF